MKPNETKKLIGHKNEFDELINIIKNNKLPNKILISGEKGIGKSVFSYHLINYLLSKNEKFLYNTELNQINNNNKSFNLIINASHPNFINIKKKLDKKSIEISQIREINNFINKSVYGIQNKIVLIDGVENLSNASGSALLKILEEPRSNVQFILIYDSSKFILDTIKSRCIEFKLNLKDKDIEKIVDTYFENNIFDEINNNFKDMYLKPKDYINLINLFKELNLDLKNSNIDYLIKHIISSKIYKNKNISSKIIKTLIEIYFLKTYKLIRENDIYSLAKYFNKKYSETLKYNLDLESLFIELKLKLIDEK